jgi:polysaccharide biosynthesis transport protein
LLISVGFVMLRERTDHRLQAPGETSLWLNVPELQVIPKINKELTGTVEHRSRRSNGTSISPYVTSRSAELVTSHQAPSLIADSFRSLLTSLLLCGENGNRPRVLVVTSANPGEGKTTVVSNLGVALAEIKRRVLIIDADLRKPRIHEVFNIGNGRGLGDLLSGPPVSLDSLADHYQQSNIPGLFVMPSGPVTQSTSSLLYSENFSRLVSLVKRDFEMVIIDTPPMLHIPDARLAGHVADGVVLVTRAGQTTRDAAAAANQRFSEDKIRVLGTILNDWDPDKAARYSERYGYYNNAS